MRRFIPSNIDRKRNLVRNLTHCKGKSQRKFVLASLEFSQVSRPIKPKSAKQRRKRVRRVGERCAQRRQGQLLSIRADGLL